MSAQAAIENWVREYCVKQHRLRIVGGVASIGLSLVVLLITYYLVRFFLWFSFSWLLGTGWGLTFGAWMVMALLFVAYFTANYQELEELQFESKGKLVTARVASYVSGNSFLALAAGPETMHSFVKVLSVTILAGPALLFNGLRLFQSAAKLKQLDVEMTATTLRRLAKAGTKIPLGDLLENVPDANPVTLIDSMQQIDGVIIRRGENSGMYLTEPLQLELGRARKGE